MRDPLKNVVWQLTPKTLMAILFTCSCGKRLKVADQFGGKRCRCPGCGEIRSVPEPSAADEGAALADESPMGAGRSRGAATEIRAQRRGDIPEVLPADDDDEDAYEPRSAEERPRRRKKKLVRKRLPEKRGFFSFEKGLADKGALAGVLMMVIAVVWFVCGLIFLNRIFFYPPILFVIGVIAFIKGLTS
jgi:hypothetical protein